MFVEGDKVAEGHGKAHLGGFAERVTPGLVVEPRHKQRKAEGIQSGIGQSKVVRQWRKRFLLRRGDFLYGPHYSGSCRHDDLFALGNQLALQRVNHKAPAESW